ncbi:MAG: response regulator transcription factor [Bacteroidetes bacterium]|nr:response regulator transcription factor [Bacteroidota bacterium]
MNTRVMSVGILEDNDALRRNLEYYINASENYFVCFSYPEIKQLLDGKNDAIPDFILLDIHLKDADSIDSINDILKKYPAVSIIIITGDHNEQFILQAFQRGAKGYLSKPFTLNDVISTLDSLQQNGSFMSPQTATTLISLINKAEPTQSVKEKYQLTEREYEVLKLMKEGLAYRAIADKLFISYHTVNHHLKNVYFKMNVKSRSELLASYMNVI